MFVGADEDPALEINTSATSFAGAMAYVTVPEIERVAIGTPLVLHIAPEPLTMKVVKLPFAGGAAATFVVVVIVPAVSITV